MHIHRSLGVSRLVIFLAAHRARTAHERLLGRLDRALAEARELCERAAELHPDDPYRDTAAAFQTVLARPARDWTHRADMLARTVRTDGDTICGARAAELCRPVDAANVAFLRGPENGRAWRDFYRSAMKIGPCPLPP